MFRHGEIASGSDSLQKVLDAPSHDMRAYNAIIAYVETNPALLQIGDGTKRRIPVPTTGVVDLTGLHIKDRIQAINMHSGSNFADLHVTVIQS